MREYEDDNIRLYTPLLQRIIILVAVIIAVPVILWTITTFVRTYIARPEVPTFQRMSETAPADNMPDASQTAPATPAPVAQSAAPPAPTPQIADAGTASSDTRATLLEIKKPVVDSQPAAVSAAPPVTPAPQIAAVTPAPMVQPAPVTPSPPTPSPSMAAPAAAPAMAPPAPPSPPQTATTKTDSVKTDSVKTDSVAQAQSASDRGFAWPNPNSNAPPAFGSDSKANSAASPAVPLPARPPETTTAAEDLSAGEPISGPIPLPRRRPNDVAMLQPLPSPGAIPLPRARPADAPAATPTTTDAPASPFDPGMTPGHY